MKIVWLIMQLMVCAVMLLLGNYWYNCSGHHFVVAIPCTVAAVLSFSMAIVQLIQIIAGYRRDACKRCQFWVDASGRFDAYCRNLDCGVEVWANKSENSIKCNNFIKK